MQKSIWQQVSLPKFDSLHGDKHTDVLVIGGGMAGILCADRLRRHGVDVTLVEQHRLLSGVSGNTTAKITMQHGLIYHKLMQSLGKERAMLYARANQHAVETYRTLCNDIDCDFETQDAYVYSQTDRQKIESEAGALHHLGIAAIVRDETDLPFPVAGAVMIRKQAQFHPVRFVAGILPDLTIYENTPVRTLDGTTAVTPQGRIHAKHVIVATHFPFLNRHGLYFLKLYQHRSYVLALQNAANVHGMYIGAEENTLSFRNLGDTLLLGGGGHRTGKPGGAWQVLENAAQEYYPTSQTIARWATQDCMSLDAMPYIGPYSPKTPNIYVATGFCKWGMTGSMVASEVLTQTILGRPDPYDGLFSPARSILKPQLVRNTLSAATNLMRISKRRCPHMGCALRWNKAEHTWDCPCHGSRFSEDGKLLDNPATEDLPE